MNTFACLRDNLSRASERGAVDYENGVEFAACPYPLRTLERSEWEAAWRRADYRRKELLPMAIQA